MHRLLPLLAFLSGVSGIAYEVLYVRLISAYLGNIFYVSAALLAIFFLGIALGSFFANRYVNYLKQIELGIGGYAIALMLVFKSLGLSVTGWVASLPGPNVIVLPLFVFVILAIPATAIGFSLPLFAAFIQHYKQHRQTFNATYALYNIGAAISVIMMEYLLVRNLGISNSILIVATINIIIGCLLFQIKSPPQVSADDSVKLLKALDADTTGLLVALFCVSVVSGVLQLNLFNLLQIVIGPHNENFALLVGVSLLGIAGAAVFLRYVRLEFNHSLLIIVLLCLIPFVFLTQIIEVYVDVHLVSKNSLLNAAFARFVFVALLSLPIFVAFSMTIPIVVARQGNRFAGLALSVSATGNALGYLLFIFIVFENLSHLAVVIGCAILVAIIYLGYDRRQFAPKAVACLLLVAGLSLAANQYWPENLYSSDYDARLDPAIAKAQGNPVTIETIKRFNDNTTLVTRENGSIELHVNGYLSLTFRKDDLAALRESLVGAVASLFTGSHDNAMVFGLGSGVTAGAAANIYKKVVIAEINPTMLETASRFARENDAVLEKTNARIYLQDGLITLLASTEKFDAIINTVPSPRFFSANKLWTADVFAEVKKRLKSPGVFVGWVDDLLGLDGLDVLQNTLNHSFRNCLYLYLSSAYQAFVCSDDELRLRVSPEVKSYPVISRILERNGWQGNPRNFLQTLLFNSPREIPEEAGLNTLDRPLLEYTSRPGSEYKPVLGSFFRLLGRDPFDDSIKPNFCRAVKILEPKNIYQQSKWCP